MDELNKTAATEPETRPEAAKLQDAPRRRVGSLTLGACLIAAGIFFLCYYFVPGFDWQLVVRIAPAAALVLLGCEVLFFAARPGRWKYDFVSVLVCLGLIAVCMCLSFLPMVWSEIDPARGQNEMKLSKAYTTQVYEALRKENPDLRLRDVYTDLYLYSNDVNALQEMQPGDGHLSLTVMLYGPYDSTGAFAQDCRSVAGTVRAGTLQPDELRIVWSPDNDPGQSLDSGILHLLGREHTPAQALHSVEMLKNAGMPHINMDLMFAIPGQTLSIWEATLKEAVRAGTDHISAYNLTYEEDTEFFRSLLRGEKRQDPDEDASFFELAEHMLEAAGMRHYETSNYAREGCLSPHNMAYWKGEDYVGIGPGAVSTINGIRYSNTRDTDAYIRSTLENGLPLSEQEPVTEEDYRLERIALMLRTDEGLPLKYILPESRPLLEQYRELGLADISPEQRLILKGRGRLLVDAIAAELC